jgi:hypothetical protein
MPHYRYSEGMFFYEDYRFPLQVTNPVTSEKVMAALEECAEHMEEVVSAYRSFSNLKRVYLLFRSILREYIDLVSTGDAVQLSAVHESSLPMESHCLL